MESYFKLQLNSWTSLLDDGLRTGLEPPQLMFILGIRQTVNWGVCLFLVILIF